MAEKTKFERTKPHINIGTIGHVDHGKTTLTSAITKVLSKQPNNPTQPLEFADIDKAPEEKEIKLLRKKKGGLLLIFSTPNMKQPSVIMLTLIVLAMPIM